MGRGSGGEGVGLPGLIGDCIIQRERLGRFADERVVEGILCLACGEFVSYVISKMTHGCLIPSVSCRRTFVATSVGERHRCI